MTDAILTTTAVDRTLPAWRVRSWHATLVLGVVAIGAYYQLPKAGWAQCILLTVLNGTAAVAAGVAALRSHGWQRTVWVSMAIAMLLSTVGNALYFGYPLAKRQPLPFPSYVDVPLLAVYPFFFVALLALTRVHRGPRRRISWVVAPAVMVAGWVWLWKLIVTPAGEVPLPSLGHKVSMAYPALAVVVFALLAWFVCRARGRNASSGWLVASFVMVIVGAIQFSAAMGDLTYAYGGVTDGLWMVSYLLVGVAALHPTASTAPRHRITES